MRQEGAKAVERKRDFYVVVTQTGTILSRVVRFFTRKPYSHASVSFNRELTDMASFGRLVPKNPFLAGFVHESREKGVFLLFKNTRCRVYHRKVTEEQYRRARAVVARFDEDPSIYKFNHLGILTTAFHVPLHVKNRYFCSQFVAQVLDESGIWQADRDYALVRPYHLYQLPGFALVYEGLLRDYDPEQARAAEQAG